MALRISRRLWTRGRPLCSGVGRCPSRYAHSASERSVRYGFLMCLMHARVATQIPDYPFSDSFLTEFSEVRRAGLPRSPIASVWGVEYSYRTDATQRPHLTLPAEQATLAACRRSCPGGGRCAGDAVGLGAS